MNMQTTQWSPDTCRCVFEYEWDKDLPPDRQVIRFKTVVKTCEHHNRIASGEQIYETVREENKRKNRFQGRIIQDYGEDGAIQGFGEEPPRGLPITKDFRWTYALDRKLDVSLPGFIGAELDDIRVIIRNEFDDMIRVTGE